MALGQSVRLKIMPLPRCPYCREVFTPSRYRPDQVVCSDSDCQRRRRTAYHRQKLKDDPTYREQCLDSRQQWREEHPEYMRNYRRANGRSKAKFISVTAEALVQLLERVKNNVAFDLTSCPARVWLISSNEQVKNILATAELIVVQGLSAN